MIHNKLWTDPVLVSFSTLPIKSVFRHQNDAWIKFTDMGSGHNALNLDTGSIHVIAAGELVEEFDADLVPHTEE